MAEKELTFKDVADHNTKKDLWLVIHDKVYDISKFVDEHPGGEEVLLDVAGQDASEDFEDVGHSDEAREILAPLFVGNLKRLPGDPAPKSTANKSGSGLTQGDRTSAGLGLYAIIVVVAAIAYGVYQWHLKQQASA